MIDLVKTHLTHPWGPPWTLETLGDPWRPLATCLKMTILGNFNLVYFPMKVLNLQTNVENMSGILKTIPKKFWDDSETKKSKPKNCLLLPIQKNPTNQKNILFFINVNWKNGHFCEIFNFPEKGRKVRFWQIFLGKHILMLFWIRSRISGMSEPPCALKSKFRRQWSKNGLYQFS